MKILILGKGFISEYLVNYLNDTDHSVECYSRKELDYSNDVTLYNKIVDDTEFGNAFDKGYEVIINTAGFTGSPNVDECELRKAECFDLNVKLPKTIEGVCKASGINFINVSSGCIYTGYDKDYTEEDEPNFGMYNNEASFYSKTKHACELTLDNSFTNTIRIRMPITSKDDHKNLLSKLNKYDNIIDFKNSKTDVIKLCEFIKVVVENFKPGIYNAVHNNTLTTREVTEIMTEYGLQNDNWKFVPYEDLPIKANRSNCVLDNSKAKRDFDFDFGDEEHYIRLNSSIIGKELGWKKN
jgi:dTDP-4-dehydrorhamnose reductase